MPKVKGKTFPYTPEGKAEAKKEAAKSKGGGKKPMPFMKGKKK